MDTQRMTEILDNLRFIKAQAESNAFISKLEGGNDEKLENVLRLREQLVTNKQQLEIHNSLDKYRTSNIEDVLERSLVERLDAVNSVRLNRQVNDIEARLEVLDAWIESNITI